MRCARLGLVLLAAGCASVPEEECTLSTGVVYGVAFESDGVTPNDHANVDATPLSEEDDPWDAESRAQMDNTDSLGSFAFTLDAGELWVLMASWYDEDPSPEAWGTVWESEPAEVLVRACAEVELTLITDLGFVLD